MNSIASPKATATTGNCLQAAINILAFVCLGGLLISPSIYAIAGLVFAAIGSAIVLMRSSSQGSVDQNNQAISLAWVSRASLLYAAVGICVDLLNGSHLGAYEMYIPFLWAPLLFVSVRRGALSFSWFWLGIALGAVLAGGFSLFQSFSLGISRPQGFIGSPITHGNAGIVLAALCMVGLFLAPMFRRKLLWRLWRLWMLVGITGGVISSFLSESKGGWVSLILVILWTAIMVPTHQTLKKRMAIALFLVCAGSLAAFNFSDSVRNRILPAFEGLHHYAQNQKTVDGSVGVRLELWKFAALTWQENPWLGQGKEGLINRKNQLIDAGVIRPEARPFGSLHNEAIHLLIEKGLVGLGNWALFISLLTWGYAKHLSSRDLLTRMLAHAGVTVVICYLGFGLSDTIFVLNANRHIFVLLTMMILGMLANQLSTAQPSSKRAQSTI